MVSNTGKGHTKEEKLAAFSRLLDVQDRLRLQCPWDKKQTFESLRPNTIEETFELCDALMKRDYKDIKKELDWMRRQPQARGHKAKYREDAFYELEKVAKQRIEGQTVSYQQMNLFSDFGMTTDTTVTKSVNC